MNKREKSKIDRGYREARVSAFLGDVGDIRVVLAWLAVGALVAAIMAVLLSQPRFVAHTTGHAVGQYSHQGYSSPPTWLVSVRLDTGGTISINMPKNQTYRTDAAMSIDVYEQGFGPIRWNSYRFKGYAEPTG